MLSTGLACAQGYRFERRTYVFWRQKDLLPVHGSVFRLFWRALFARLRLHARHLNVILLFLEPHRVAVRSKPAMRQQDLAALILRVLSCVEAQEVNAECCWQSAELQVRSINI